MLVVVMPFSKDIPAGELRLSFVYFIAKKHVFDMVYIFEVSLRKM